MELPYDPVEQIRTDGVALIDLVTRHDPDTRVESCPEWTLADLARHIGGVWHFWARVVAGGITDRGDLQTIESPGRLEGTRLLDWVAVTHNELYSALVDAPPDRPVWTWTGSNRDAAWVQRRMAQETAVHRWDAANSVGDPYEVPTEVAADGIDEFLTWFAGRERREGEMKVGGTVHLHCTDTSDTSDGGASESDTPVGEWFISAMKEPSVTFSREHRKGDVAVRGRAHDLLMWVWRRDAGPVEVIGNEVVARRFRAYTDLD